MKIARNKEVERGCWMKEEGCREEVKEEEWEGGEGGRVGVRDMTLTDHN